MSWADLLAVAFACTSASRTASAPPAPTGTPAASSPTAAATQTAPVAGGLPCGDARCASGELCCQNRQSGATRCANACENSADSFVEAPYACASNRDCPHRACCAPIGRQGSWCDAECDADSVTCADDSDCGGFVPHCRAIDDLPKGMKKCVGE